ncbi:prepilin-type cleavage/methylation domain-containing protein [Orrella marina]|uniref:Prepilin-type cleavage/methylation domain-containing protein n=2 Tax=Orrella marina TaxID=2163011 RepID=A0A2R4XPG4_9BURK|nr:prepilin-type cleavage/methylation domain-containing protein [Orrella marina]
MARAIRGRLSARSITEVNRRATVPIVNLFRQRGFSLVEVSIVTALMILIAIIGIPAIQGYVIENKVPRVAEDLQRFIARMKVSGIGAGPAPYLSVSQRTLVNGLRDAAAIHVQSKDQAVVHGLGGAGQAGKGTVSLLPATLPGGVEGSAFKLVLTNVNHAACPALAAVMQRMAVQVKVGGQGPGQEVKNSAAIPAREYDPILADAQCMAGDVNTFEFVIQ